MIVPPLCRGLMLKTKEAGDQGGGASTIYKADPHDRTDTLGQGQAGGAFDTWRQCVSSVVNQQLQGVGRHGQGGMFVQANNNSREQHVTQTMYVQANSNAQEQKADQAVSGQASCRSMWAQGKQEQNAMLSLCRQTTAPESRFQSTLVIVDFYINYISNLFDK